MEEAFGPLEGGKGVNGGGAFGPLEGGLALGWPCGGYFEGQQLERSIFAYGRPAAAKRPLAKVWRQGIAARGTRESLRGSI